MKDPLQVALVGNSFASRVQLPALRWAGGNRVVGLAGRDLAKARATADEWRIPYATDDWRALLERDCDLVIVTTPVDLHHPMVVAALEAGRHVLCEKPFALDAGQAHDLVQRADELTSQASDGAKTEAPRCFLDHELRWSPHLAELRRLLEAGEAGEPLHVAIEMLLPPATYRQRPWSWWFDAARGGGILGALGSHLVDLLRWLLGEIGEVRADLAHFVDERADEKGVLRPVSADDYAALSLRFRSGCLGTLQTSIALPSERSFRLQVTGSEQTLRLVGGDQLWVGPTSGPLQERKGIGALASCEELGLPAYGLFGQCLPYFLRDLVVALRSGEPLPRAATFEDGLRTQLVLDAARQSAATRGGWVPSALR